MTRKKVAVIARCLEAYGGKCACCGESRLWFLTIDHIRNDGHLESASVRGGIYAWLTKRGFPKEGIQVLCYNCNCGKARIGGSDCPHKFQKIFGY